MFVGANGVDGVIDQHGGALITGVVAILVAVITVVATTVGERQREQSERASAREAITRDAYASVLAAAARFGNALSAEGEGANGARRVRASGKANAAATGVYEAAALAMLVGSEPVREALGRLQMAVSEATVALEDGREVDGDWIGEWSGAKTDLLELARREVGWP